MPIRWTSDLTPSFYIYQKITATNTYCGIIATTSVEDYYNNVIRKHECTLQEKEELFENYLITTGFNVEPVLLTYPDNDEIDEIIKKHQQKSFWWSWNWLAPTGKNCRIEDKGRRHHSKGWRLVCDRSHEDGNDCFFTPRGESQEDSLG